MCFQIRRQFIVEDSLQKLELIAAESQEELRKQLVIQFQVCSLCRKQTHDFQACLQLTYSLTGLNEQWINHASANRVHFGPTWVN